MKKLHIIVSMFVIAICLMTVWTAQPVAAVDVLDQVCKNTAQGTPDVCQDNSTNGSNPLYGPSGILTDATRILSFLVGVIAVIVIILSGLRMILANGDSNSITTARNSLIYALVALAVAALAQVLVAFVLSKL